MMFGYSIPKTFNSANAIVNLKKLLFQKIMVLVRKRLIAFCTIRELYM